MTDKLINNTFRFRELGEWVNKTTDDIFADKEVVIFGLPGAFTPTCSLEQLPGYESAFAEFKKVNIDDIYCISVNDAFVMNAWAENQGLKNVKVIADGDGAFTRSLGMLVDKPAQKFGLRSWRYSAFIVDGNVQKVFVEPGINNDGIDEDPFEVSDARTMLTWLNSAASSNSVRLKKYTDAETKAYFIDAEKLQKPFDELVKLQSKQSESEKLQEELEPLQSTNIE